MQLHRDREQFDAAGVRLAVIGQGRPEQAARFRDKQKVEGLELYVDERRLSYKAAGAKKATLGELLGPQSVAKGVKNATKGINQGRIVGHPAQLGGILVVKPDGSIAYTHLSENPADTPPNEEVLEAARKAASG